MLGSVSPRKLLAPFTATRTAAMANYDERIFLKQSTMTRGTS